MSGKKSEVSLIIRGWKGLQEYTGYHSRTLQRWHLERARLPIIKTHVYSKTSRWIVMPKMVEAWLEMLGVQFKKIK